MIRILDNVNILFSRLGSLRGQSAKLHDARFALPHELHSLTSHMLDEEALLLGRTHLGGIYRLKPTRERRELGNTTWKVSRNKVNKRWPLRWQQQRQNVFTFAATCQ
jgi:hypothetical protein